MTSRMIHAYYEENFDYKILSSSVARAVNSLKKKKAVVVKQVAPCIVSGRSSHYIYFPDDENDRGLGGYLSKVDDELNEAERSDLSDDNQTAFLPDLEAFDRSSPVRHTFQKYKILSFDWIQKEASREKRIRKDFYKRKFHIVQKDKLDNGKQVSKNAMTKGEYWKRVGVMDYLSKLSEIMEDKDLSPSQLLELLDKIPGKKQVEQGRLFK